MVKNLKDVLNEEKEGLKNKLKDIADKRKEMLDFKKEDDDKLKYFEKSHWLQSRSYDEGTGLLVIYFKVFETNGKPPVVLNRKVEKSFVEAFDSGIWSRYYKYPDSSGAFYMRYIKGNVIDIQELNIKKTILIPTGINSYIKKLSNINYIEQEIKSYVKDRINSYLEDFLKEKIKSLGKDFVLDKKYLQGKLIEKVLNKIFGENILEKFSTDGQSLSYLYNSFKEFSKGGKMIGSKKRDRTILLNILKSPKMKAFIATEKFVAKAVSAVNPELLFFLSFIGKSSAKSLAKNEKFMKENNIKGISIIKIMAIKLRIKQVLNEEIKKIFRGDKYKKANINEIRKSFKQDHKFVEHKLIDETGKDLKKRYKPRNFEEQQNPQTKNNKK